MDKVWSFIRSPENRSLVSWLAGGAVAIIAGLWTLFVYFFPPTKDAPATTGAVIAECGSAAQQGWSFLSSVTVTGPRDCGSATSESDQKK